MIGLIIYRVPQLPCDIFCFYTKLCNPFLDIEREDIWNSALSRFSVVEGESKWFYLGDIGGW